MTAGLYFEAKPDHIKGVMSVIPAADVTAIYSTYREVLALPHVKGRVVYSGKMLSDGTWLVETAAVAHA